MAPSEIITIAIAIVAAAVAFWQAFLSKQQLEESRRVKSETETMLDSINRKVESVQTISDETRRDVKDQIAKLIDRQDENFKTLLNAPKDRNQTEMILALMPKLLENPEMLSTLVKLGNQRKGENQNQ